MGKILITKSTILLITIFLLMGVLVPVFSIKALNTPEPIKFKPNLSIPGAGSEFIAGQETDVKKSGQPTLMVRYFQAIYKFFVGIAGIIAVFMIVFGGMIWLFSGGSSEKIGKAKDYITGAILGLLIAVGSYMILYNVNPGLVNFQLDVREVPGISLPAFWCQDISMAYDQANSLFPCEANCNSDAIQSQTQCGATYKVPGQAGNQTCRGNAGCGSGKMCSIDHSTASLETECVTYEEACERINDDATAVMGLPDSQAACNSIELPIGPVCLWFDLSGLAEAGGAGFIDDGCRYFSSSKITNLCNPSGSSVIDSCSEYNGSLGSGIFNIPPYGFSANPIDWILSAGDLGGVFEATHKAFCLEDPCYNYRINSNQLTCNWSWSNGCQ